MKSFPYSTFKRLSSSLLLLTQRLSKCFLIFSDKIFSLFHNWTIVFIFVVINTTFLHMFSHLLRWNVFIIPHLHFPIHFIFIDIWSTFFWIFSQLLRWSFFMVLLIIQMIVIFVFTSKFQPTYSPSFTLFELLFRILFHFCFILTLKHSQICVLSFVSMV